MGIIHSLGRRLMYVCIHQLLANIADNLGAKHITAVDSFGYGTVAAGFGGGTGGGDIVVTLSEKGVEITKVDLGNSHRFAHLFSAWSAVVEGAQTHNPLSNRG